MGDQAFHSRDPLPEDTVSALQDVPSAIWQHGFQQDPYSGTEGRKYWAECLSHGGGKPSHLLVSDYLGQAVTQPAALAGGLIQEVDTKRKEVERASKRR